ncbi:MAG: DUF87 domain-containing protein [Lachnospiraceae bacterium]|nr:DUF87 domain-containing protein [Lachnospiraceae bacterium]
MATLGAALVLLFAISSLPWKLGICIAIAFVTFFLVLRLDDEPNYQFVLRILKYVVLPKRFSRVYDDAMMRDIRTGKLRRDVIENYREQNKKEGKRRRKVEEEQFEEEQAEFFPEESGATESAEAITGETIEQEVETAGAEAKAPESDVSNKTDAGEAEKPGTADEADPYGTLKSDRELAKERKKREKELIREENRILKSKTATEEEKNAVWMARAERSALKKKEKEEAKEGSSPGEFMENLIAFTDIKDGFIEYGGKYYGKVIEIDPIEFRFFSQHRRNNSIENGIGKTLRSLQEGNYANIIKIERPIKYDDYIEREYGRLEQLKKSYESGILSEDELKARVEVLYDRINELTTMCFDEKVVTAYYYLALFEQDRARLNLQISNAMHNLEQGELTGHVLDTKELAVFLKYTNQLDFDEREIDEMDPEDYAQWAMPENVRIKVRDTIVSGVVTHTYRVSGYPTLVGDAFLAGVMSIPGTKVVLKCTPIDRNKGITAIDRSLQELRSQYQNTNVDSKLIELGQHISSLSGLLTTLQGDNETLMDVNIYVTVYDIAASRMDPSVDAPVKSSLPVIGEMDKVVRQLWSEENIRVSRLDFDQLNAFIGSQVSNYDPLKKLSRGMPSNSVAATFPWIYAHISDTAGFKLGSAEGIPVFVDFFRRDNERINSNMVIIGKSGSGKSYATKSLLANLSADDAKIFILDPENEYTELAGNMHGKIINVGNAQYGRLNPFHIITALDDDEEDGTGTVTGSFATHLQFLEEFFKQILPDCEKDALEYLNSLVERMYTNRGIYADTDLSGYAPEDYPIFDDLYDEVLAEFERTENEYLRTMLRTLINYIAKFSTGGRNANIWNGPSTVTTEENFTVFNFQSMLSNRNTTIANAQMLLVLKYIDNEIIKNRDYNTRYNLNRKIVVVIDEAHVFIDEKFPIALDFMFQLAKRIRKYNGMQIVITQNIKDFVGSEELARKSTAIINACQYSFIFALAPNDIHDLCKLYEKAGGINSHEQEQIMQAPRGQAFTVLSASSRSTFQVEVPPSMVDMFQKKEYTSHYFIGEQGYANWESFVAASRSTHDLSAAANRAAEQIISENRPKKKAVTFNILTEEEMAARTAAVSDVMQESVSPEQTDDLLPDDLLFDDDMTDEQLDALLAQRREQRVAEGGEETTEALYEEAAAGEPAFAAEEETYAAEEETYAVEEETYAAEDETYAAEEAAADAAVSYKAPARSYRASRSEDVDHEIEVLRREMELERNRLEAERLETQRKTIELEKAALEAQKSAGIQDAVLKLGEMLQVMQQQIMLQQSGASVQVPAAAVQIPAPVVQIPAATVQTSAIAPSFSAAPSLSEEEEPFASDLFAEDTDTMQTSSESTSRDMEDQDLETASSASDFDFGFSMEDDFEAEDELDDEELTDEEVELLADDELRNRELSFADLSEGIDADEDEDSDEDENFDFDLDDEDEDEEEDEDTDLPDADEFEKFLFGDDDEDDEDDDDDDDDDGLSFNIFDMFEQEAEYMEKYNPMDDFMEGEDDILEITIEQLTEYNANRRKMKNQAG